MRIVVTFSEEQHAKLQQAAADNMLSKAGLIRKAVADYIRSAA